MVKRLATCLLVLAVSSVQAEVSVQVTVEGLETQLGMTFSDDLSTSVAEILDKIAASEGHSAIAAAISDTDQIVLGYGAQAPAEVGATMSALQSCQTQQQSLQTDHPGVCEVIVLNGEHIETASALKAGLDDTTPAFVWEVQSPESILYLAGSVHAMKAAMYPLAPAFRDSYAKADRVAFEVNPLALNDPALLAKLQPLMLGDMQLNNTTIVGDTRQALTDVAAINAIPVQGLFALKPTMIATQLALLKYTALGYGPENGLDINFAQRAQQDGKEILELETPEGQLAALLAGSQTAQVAILETALATLEDSEDVISDLTRHWLRGDAEALYQLIAADYASELEEVRAIGRALVEERNHGMVAKISEYLGQPSTTFVMVGAGHMGGPEGIVPLLRQKGYAVRQLNRGGGYLDE